MRNRIFKSQRQKYRKKYRDAHREEIALYQKTYRKNHKKEIKIYNRQYRKEHHGHLNAASVLYGKKHKKELGQKKKQRDKNHRKIVFEHYGVQCCRCGISDIDVLTIDHIKPVGGKKRRKQLHGGSGHSIYIWLIKQNLPNGYQTLCRNCNWKKFLREDILKLIKKEK